MNLGQSGLRRLSIGLTLISIQGLTLLGCTPNRQSEPQEAANPAAVAASPTAVAATSDATAASTSAAAGSKDSPDAASPITEQAVRTAGDSANLAPGSNTPNASAAAAAPAARPSPQQHSAAGDKLAPKDAPEATGTSSEARAAESPAVTPAEPPPADAINEAGAETTAAPANPEDYQTCRVPENPLPDHDRKEAYAGVPFQPGERAEYEMSYMGVHAGYGAISVDRPVKLNDRWHRVFTGEANTGDWYKFIFVLKDKIVSWSRPWDFGIAKFYMEQDEGKLFSERYVRKKWIEFDHAGCKTKEKEQRKGRPEKNGEFELRRGSIDTLGATFNLRTRDYKVGEVQLAPIYSSEKNWLLEATPVLFEEVETKAGKFKAVKLKLQTYIGQELQQKGDVYIWIATDHPNRPMVQVQGEIKIGSIWIKLSKFVAGTPL